MITNKYTNNFLITLSILPLLVQVIIMMVNGNLGTSVAVLGAFSLIRFRSVPGNSREIISIFFAMAIGLAIGMGHIVFAVVITLLGSLMLIVYSKYIFKARNNTERKLKILIPENLNYYDAFSELFEKYTLNNTLERVKTTNMGTMYDLTYSIVMKNNVSEKDFIDDIRCRNGNLTVMIGMYKEGESEL